MTMCTRLRNWLRARGMWFWATAGIAVGLFVLWGGSQYAHDLGQSVEWYTGFGQWLGGIGSLVAALVALGIATRDRNERTIERRDEEKTHARLVRLEARSNIGSPTVSVTIRNYGPLPILDVELVDAEWTEYPELRWGTDRLMKRGLYHPLLKPQPQDDDTIHWVGIRYHIWLMHPTVDEPLIRPVELPATPGRNRPPHAPEYAQIDMANVVIKVRFTTANGVRWEVPTRGEHTGEPVRLN
ncbi:hypothetical protein PR370_01045 [Mycobacterium marinum]|uniref:hypothetical protein n=1 Tax=Mycobacterium marinum TaxID=1781 RepID=UPI0023596ED3|nr:hypothetical protein [Mycobacterium marinum]MDC8980680.1 hypothetical protein [Mycobacterium marinum]MDC8997894.1 hypothetical protein [Mycobacterium marinum]MDC9008634.1 hypothetical protein [Mycobacterium marinum]